MKCCTDPYKTYCLLRSTQIRQKCTILANSRTITQERKKETRQMTPFFSSTFWALTVCDVHFCIWKLPKFIFMGSSFCPFWSAKYLNFGGVSCEIRIFYSGNIHIKESKKPGFTFSIELRTKFVWSRGLLLFSDVTSLNSPFLFHNSIRFTQN